MIKCYRFHFMIDKYLLKEIDDARVTMKIKSRNALINRILEEMAPILEEIETIPEERTIKDDWFGYKMDINIRILPENFQRLKYFHFRFNTFSIATILRRILRIYLRVCNEIIALAIEEVKKIQSGRTWFCTKFMAHMDHKIGKNKRILTLNHNFYLNKLTVYT